MAEPVKVENDISKNKVDTSASAPFPAVMGTEKQPPTPIIVQITNNNTAGVAPVDAKSYTCCGHCKNMCCSCWYGCEVCVLDTVLCCGLTWECCKKSSGDQSHCCKSCCGHWGVCCREAGLACYFCKG